MKLAKLFPVKRVFARIIGDIGEIAINFAKRCSDGENDEHYIELGMQNDLISNDKIEKFSEKNTDGNNNQYYD